MSDPEFIESIECKEIAEKLEGKSVKPKYQRKYGKKYSKTEAKEAATKIKGAQRAKELANKYKK